MEYTVLGLMSGTSLDGLDIACCRFSENSSKWGYDIIQAGTIPYQKEWLYSLRHAHQMSSYDLHETDAKYGRWLGEQCLAFIERHQLPKPDFIASHGHTIIHRPRSGVTLQIGNGNHIHAASGIPVIWDFRSLDVALGGEGAPLVPIGDKLLFSSFDACLNLGGIGNISFEDSGKRKAFDICFVNMGFNYLAGKLGKPMDENGDIARAGKTDTSLLSSLLSVYDSLPKSISLGREIFEAKVQPLLDNTSLSTQDAMKTFSESVAEMVRRAFQDGTVLVTGGGALNRSLIGRLKQLSPGTGYYVPDLNLVQFKEAMIFAFLGVLKHRGETNCLSSVTNAKKDSSSGQMAGF